MKTLKCRVESLELRTCDDNLLSTSSKEHMTASIVKWKNSFCYVLAYWLKDTEGYELKFIGDRPFEDNINKDEFWLLAEIGQKHLTKWFNENED